MQSLAELRGHWSDRVYSTTSGVLANYASRNDPNSDDNKKQKAKEKHAIEILEILSHLCELSGLTFTKKKIEEITKFFKMGITNDFHLKLEEISSRLNDELEEVIVLRLPSEKRDLYTANDEKWKIVTDKYNKLSEDIEEASKCIAMSRYTASVFHLMRVMESGVKILATKLAIPDGQIVGHNWQQIIDVVTKKIGEKWPPKNAKLNTSEKRNRQKFNEAVLLLTSVKHAWRNDVMHPKATYTEDEALNIYISTRAFMNFIIGIPKQTKEK